jgi:hypothetical protein
VFVKLGVSSRAELIASSWLTGNYTDTTARDGGP